MAISRLKACLFLGSATLAATSAMAQEDASGPADEIVVTGTKVDRSAKDTPLSVSVVSEEKVRGFTASSQADILQQLPGLKAEGGGGEVAVNFRVRGLPSAGQYEFTPLNYDGVTVFSTHGLNSSAFDFFARNDLGIERMEFVKGGVSNLFGVSSTAGVINYISKVGSEEDHGTLQLEVGEDSRYRGDFAFQGPLAENTYYAISGFYRYDEGPLDTGLPTEGFALRGNIHRDFDDGSGFVRIHGAYINDRANFYLPLPLDGTTRERVAGNNGGTVFTTNVSAIDGLRVQTPEGITEYRAGDGFQTKGGSVYGIFEKDLGDGWGVDGKLKYSEYQSASNFFNNGVGPQTPETQSQFATRFGLAGNVVFSDVATGNVLDPGFLVYQGGFNDRQRPASDATMELNFTKEIETGGLVHNFTVGGFLSRAIADNNQRSVQFLTQFDNNPALVDVTVNGQQFTVNGIVQAPSAYAQETRKSLRRAIYIADQIDAGRWKFDIGGRIEAASLDNRFELTTTLPGTLATNPVAGAPINTMRFGTGEFLEGDATVTGWAVALGALYQINDSLNIYANASRGFFVPQAQGTNGQISTTGDIRVLDEEPVYQAEVGLKYAANGLSGYIAGFYTGLRDRTTVSFVGANLTPQLTFTESDTFGVELDANFAVTDFLTLSGNFIFQDAKYVANSQANILGNELERLPRIIANLGANFRSGPFDGSFYWNYQGDTFQDAGNGVPLDAYGVARLDAGYTFNTGEDDTLRLSVNVWNIFDSEGLAEGNPRAGAVQVPPGSNAPFFNGRPILPRRVMVRLTYDF